MDATASLRFARISPRKARLVADVVRGKPAGAAVESLQFLDKKSAPMIAKLVESAIANAEQAAKLANRDLDLDTLVIKRIEVGQASSMRRFRPRAQGRATPIVKKTAHITVVIGEEA